MMQLKLCQEVLWIQWSIFYPLRKATKSSRSSETQYYIPIFVYLNPSRSVHLRNLYKNKLNFYFHTSLWCLKRFYEGL